MKVIKDNEQLSLVAKGLKKPLLWLSAGSFEFTGNPHPAAPYLGTGDALMELYVNGGVLLVCDDMKEAWSLYKQTVGDDGPTATNPYNGEERIYAMLVDADGKIITENT